MKKQPRSKNILKTLQYIFIGFPLILLSGIYKEFGSPKPKQIAVYAFILIAIGVVLAIFYYV